MTTKSKESRHVKATAKNTAPGVVERVGRVSITRVKSGSLVLRWREGGVYRSQGAGRDVADAKRRAREIDAAVDAGSGSATADTPYWQLAQRALDPADHPSWGDRYAIEVEAVTRLWVLPTLGKMRCRDIKPGHIASVLNAMRADGIGAHRMNLARKVMRMVEKRGVRDGVWTEGRGPAADIGLPDGLDADIDLHALDDDDIPSTEQVLALIDALETLDLRFALVARIAAGCAPRYSEIMGLKVYDLDLASDTPTLAVLRSRPVELKGGTKSPKTRAGKRRVPIPADLVAALRDWVADRGLDPYDYLVETRNHTPIAPSNFAKTMKRARALSGFPEGWGVHRLRHYAVSRWVNDRIPIPVVSRWAGHANPSITGTIYSHPSAEAEAAARSLLRPLDSEPTAPAAVPAPAPVLLPVAPPTGVPAGWYPDPYEPTQLRWWDGATWSGHVSQRPA